MVIKYIRFYEKRQSFSHRFLCHFEEYVSRVLAAAVLFSFGSFSDALSENLIFLC